MAKGTASTASYINTYANIMQP